MVLKYNLLAWHDKCWHWFCFKTIFNDYLVHSSSFLLLFLSNSSSLLAQNLWRFCNCVCTLQRFLFTTCFHGFMRPNSKLSQSSCLSFWRIPKKRNTEKYSFLTRTIHFNVSQIPNSWKFNAKINYVSNLFKVQFWYLVFLVHRLWTPREEIVFTARPKIKSQSQIFRFGRSIFGLPHGLRTPNEGINQINWANVADKICSGCI